MELQLLAAMIYAEANQQPRSNDEREAIAWSVMNRYRYLKYLACFSDYFENNITAYVVNIKGLKSVEDLPGWDISEIKNEIGQIHNFFVQQRNSMQWRAVPGAARDRNGISLADIIVDNDFQGHPIYNHAAKSWTLPGRYGDVLAFDPADGQLYMDADRVCNMDPENCPSLAAAIDVALNVHAESAVLEGQLDDPMRVFAGLGTTSPGNPVNITTRDQNMLHQVIGFTATNGTPPLEHPYNYTQRAYQSTNGEGVVPFTSVHFYRFNGPHEYDLVPVPGIKRHRTTYMRLTIVSYDYSQQGPGSSPASNAEADSLSDLVLDRAEGLKANATCSSDASSTAP
jgi:hypothetical protein